jgi:hypothetical protein
MLTDTGIESVAVLPGSEESVRKSIQLLSDVAWALDLLHKSAMHCGRAGASRLKPTSLPKEPPRQDHGFEHISEPLKGVLWDIAKKAAR